MPRATVAALPKGARASLWATTITGAQLAVAFMTSIVLARMLEPDERGRVAAILAWGAVAAMVGLGGLPQIMSRARLSKRDLLAYMGPLVAPLATLFTIVGAILVVALRSRLGLVHLVEAFVAFAILSVLGVARAAAHGIGEHRSVEVSMILEPLGRLAVVALIVLGTSQLTVSQAVIAYLLGVVLAMSWVMRAIRDSRTEGTGERPPDVSVGELLGSLAVPVYQQLSGRLALSLLILSETDAEVGLLAVVFALTEPALNVARILQPRLIRGVESAEELLKPAARWLVVITGAVAVTFLLRSLVERMFAPFLAFLFGPSYGSAAELFAPVGSWMLAASFNVVLVSLLYTARANAMRVSCTIAACVLTLSMLMPFGSLVDRVWAVCVVQLFYGASLLVTARPRQAVVASKFEGKLS